MPLPKLIEIEPLKHLVAATISVPGSKSITNRALILAALASGETVLCGALWSEDTQVMVECLRELGFMITVDADSSDPCNRIITVYGKGGAVPPGGSVEQPVDLFVGNAGTAARFLAAFVCLGKGVYRLHGVERMHARPQASLFQALRQLGYRVETPNDRLPAVIYATGPASGKAEVSIHESSQFASALLLCAKAGGWQITVTGNDLDEASYVAMTTKMIEVFPWSGGRFQIEPDASSGSYFLAVNGLGLLNPGSGDRSARLGVPGSGRSLVSVAHWPHSDWQVDQHFPRVLSLMESGESGPGISRAKDLGDSIMTAIVMAPLIARRMERSFFRFADLGRLRVQECERVQALRTELTRCGAKVVETGDTLEVLAGELHGAEIETYNDHRMAMCFAILGLKVPGIRIKNPACVKKTFPNFFQKMAAAPPLGLGATFREPASGRLLPIEALFAA